MAYRKNADRDEDKAKAYELEQVMVTDDCVLVAQHMFLELENPQGNTCVSRTVGVQPSSFLQ